MATRAPGQDVAREEPSCFNCGLRGHFAIACPEEVRKEPAGLQAFRERKAASQPKSSRGGAGQGRGSGGPGMIITKYAPPPNPYLPPTPQAAAILGYRPQPPPPSHAPHPAQSAGPHAWQFSPNSYSSAYQAPLPPPPAHHAQPPYESYANSSYPPPQSGSAPNGAPCYPSSYGAPPPPPPPQAYYPGVQPTYNPSLYPPHAQSTPAPGFPYLPAAPLSSPGQPYPYTAPPPPPYAPQPYTTAQAYYSPSYLEDRGRGHVHLGARDHGRSRNRGGSNNRDRNRHRDHDRDREKHKGRDRDRNFGSKHQRKGPPQKVQALPKTSEKTSSPTKPPRDNSEGSPSTPVKANGTTKALEEQSPSIEDILGCDLESVFTELPAKPADPVGQPLPSQYTDAPTIPPAFNARCLKSEFFSEDDGESFSRSIRDSRYWKDVKHDPVFMAWAGMVSRRFVNSIHLYHSYRTSSAPSPDEVIAEDVVLDEIIVKSSPPRASSPTVSNPILPEVRPDVLRKHARGSVQDGENQFYSKRFKGPMGLPQPPSFQSPSSAKRHQRGEGGSHFSHDSNDHRNTHRDSPRSRDSPHNSRSRNDSGYHSNNSSEKPHGERSYRGSNAARDYRGRSRSIPRSPSDSRSRSRSPPRKRVNTTYRQRRPSQNPSDRRGHGESPRYERTRSSSPLDDFERQILGIAREEIPEKKAAKPKRRHEKMVEVFSRRW